MLEKEQKQTIVCLLADFCARIVGRNCGRESGVCLENVEEDLVNL